MGNRKGFFIPLVAVGAFLAARCGSTQQQQPGPDSGSTTVGCTTGDDCAAGDCLKGQCVWCDDTSCAAGSYCSHNGKCLPCDGGCASSGDVGIPLDAGKSCTTRADCAGFACRSGQCGPQDPSGSCTVGDDCNSGFACSQGKCVAGCATNADCKGSPAGPRCDTASGRVGPSAPAADCHADTENCVAGSCAKAVACPDGTRAPCDAFVCVDKVCRPCAVADDCGPGFDCKDGSCEARASCTDDSQCLTLSPGHWCDKPSGLCKWGCVAGTGAACGTNCCTPPLGCNPTTHACEKVACNNCNGACIPPQTCDQGSCSCVSTSNPDGGSGGTCSAIDCSCTGGLHCSCPSGTCTAPYCFVTGKCQ
jgi:hypothetical protein